MLCLALVGYTLWGTRSPILAVFGNTRIGTQVPPEYSGGCPSNLSKTGFSRVYTLEHPGTNFGCIGHARVGTGVPPEYLGRTRVTLPRVCLVLGYMFWGTRVPNLAVLVIPG